MKPEALEHLLLRYGEDLDHWPLWQRIGARRLLSRSPIARESLARVARENQLLRRAMAPTQMPAELLQGLERIPEQFPQHSAAPQTPHDGRHLFRIGAAWACACGLSGLLIGSTGLLGSAADDEALATLAFGIPGESEIHLENTP